MIAHDPLHRAGRAALPHPAPTLGNNAQAHERIRVANLSGWEPALNVMLQCFNRRHGMWFPWLRRRNTVRHR
jgi:hypothetical protein